VGDELELEGPLPTRAARRRRPATHRAGLEPFCGWVVRPFSGCTTNRR